MINVLTNLPSRSELVEIFRRNPPVPLLPRFDEVHWKERLNNPLLSRVRADLLAAARKECAKPLPVLTEALYRDFYLTGLRRPFENVYFERRCRVGRAAFALLSEGLDLWRAPFLTALQSILSEESWALPAHLSEESGKNPRVIDLFAAETANLMGECLSLFSPIIPEDIQTRIQARLQEEFLTNYRDHAADLGWVRWSNNWNAVCHQGVLGAALALVEDPELLADLVLTAARYLPIFIGGFGEDGGCSEGPGYWEYGFGRFAALNEQLEIRTADALSLFAGDSRVVAIATYGARVTLQNQNTISFADSFQSGGLSPALFLYLARRLDLAECAEVGQENYAWLSEHGLEHNKREDVFHLTRLYLQAPDEPLSLPRPPRPDVWFHDIAVWIVRGTDQRGHTWELAAKGGHNFEHHNHNDLGSFTLQIDGVPLLTEIGSPEYVREYFRPATRYSFLASRSFGHSLPVINGCEQAVGQEYFARILESEISAHDVRFVAELAGAYPAEAGCRSFLRRLSLDKTLGHLRWEDTWELDRCDSLESALMTDADSVTLLTPSTAIIEKQGLRLELKVESGATWTDEQTHPYRSHEGRDLKIRRLVLQPMNLGPKSGIIVTIRLLTREGNPFLETP